MVDEDDDDEDEADEDEDGLVPVREVEGEVGGDEEASEGDKRAEEGGRTTGAVGASPIAEYFDIFCISWAWNEANEETGSLPLYVLKKLCDTSFKNENGSTRPEASSATDKNKNRS